MEPTLLLAFVGVALLAYVTPGPDWFVVMRHAATSRARGWLAATGVLAGLTVHLTAAALGVSAVLVASAEAFTVLKIVGAAYLVFLGVKALRDSRRHTRSDVLTPESSPPSMRTVFGTAFLTNVLNPKAALFFVAVLPQFVSGDGSFVRQVVTLGAIDLGIGFAWYTIFVLGVGAARSALGSERSRVLVDRVAGASLIGLGGALAVSGRRVA